MLDDGEAIRPGRRDVEPRLERAPSECRLEGLLVLVFLEGENASEEVE